MDSKHLSVINKSLLFFIAALVALGLFIISYFGPSQFEATLVGAFLFFGGYHLGKSINHDWIRRSINIFLTASLTGMLALLLFFWIQSSPEGIEWFYWILFALISCGLLVSSIRQSIRYWNRPQSFKDTDEKARTPTT